MYQLDTYRYSTLSPYQVRQSDGTTALLRFPPRCSPNFSSICIQFLLRIERVSPFSSCLLALSLVWSGLVWLGLSRGVAHCQFILCLSLVANLPGGPR